MTMFEFDTVTSILDLYAVVGGKSFYVTDVGIQYGAYDAIKSSCSMRIAARRKSGSTDKTMAENTIDIDDLRDSFSNGSEVFVYWAVATSESATSARSTILYRGFVSSTRETQQLGADFVSSGFFVELTSPERLIPTNPCGSVFSVTHNGSVSTLLVNSMFYQNSKYGELSSFPELEKKLLNSDVINIAEVAATVLDAERTDTLLNKLPATISSMVDIESAPKIYIATKQSCDLARMLVQELKQAQISGGGDWEAFDRVLRQFYLNAVPNTSYKSSRNYKYIKIVKNFNWSNQVADNIKAEDFVSYSGISPSYIDGNFQSVAVAFPYAGQQAHAQTDDPNCYALCLLGYDASGRPKKYQGQVDDAFSAAGVYKLQEAGMAVKNIRKMYLPNWVQYTINEKNEDKSHYAKYAAKIAAAEAAATIGAEGSISLTMRAPALLKYLDSLGKVVSVELPDSVGDSSTTKFYGMLYRASLRITLEQESLRAEGTITLTAVRDKATQAAFSANPEIFADAAKR